jgi:hypothetical protein
MKKTIFSGLFLLGSTSFWAQQKITYELLDMITAKESVEVN